MTTGVNDVFIDSDDIFSKNLTKGKSESNVHIRIQQRNGRKKLTTIQGLGEALDKKKILRTLKRDLSCNGTIIVDKVLGTVIQLQGDHRFLQERGLVEKDSIVVHGA